MRDLLIDTVIVECYKQPQLKPSQLILRWYDVLHLSFIHSISMPYLDGFISRCRGTRKISVTGEIHERQPVPEDPLKRRGNKNMTNNFTLSGIVIDISREN